jgi:predicted metal-dependent hydrolase
VSHLRVSCLEVNDLTIHIKRSGRRKTLLLRVIDEKIQVNAPLFTSNHHISQFVIKNHAWIAEQKRKSHKKLSFMEGETIWFLGCALQLTLFSGPKQVFIEESKLCLYHPNPDPENIEKSLTAFLRKQAQSRLINQALNFESVFPHKATSLKVNTFKARWGSCSESGMIQLNWKLIFAPIDIIDYVIIHEYCHLRHFNHSKAFWSLVSTYCPAYKVAKKWLKENAHRLLGV